MRHLFGRPLFDWNLLPTGRIHVYGGPWRRDVERDAMLFCQDRYGVGPNLVGNVAIRGNAVRAHDYGADLALLHDRACHVVGDDGGGNTVFHEFPGSQTRTLQERARLVGVDVNLLSSRTALPNPSHPAP